jgi:hypothetical protein
VRLQVTTRSWLGAVVHRTGGGPRARLVAGVGFRHSEHHLPSLRTVNSAITGGLIVAQDVLGGQFAWAAATTATATIVYFPPDSLIRFEILYV